MTPPAMGIHFGNLARVRHIITYSLSPFEQRAFPNVFSDALPNVWRRFSSQVFKVVPRECRGGTRRVFPPFFVAFWGGEAGLCDLGLCPGAGPALSVPCPCSLGGRVPALLVGLAGVRAAQEEEPG